MALDWQVDATTGDEAAYAVLSRDRIWNGYSIADLAPPFRESAQVAIARGDGERIAAVLILRHPEFCALVPYGDLDGVVAILATVELPARANLLALTRGSGEIINIGTGIGTSINQIFDRLVAIAGTKIERVHGPAKLGEVYRTFLDASKAQAVLGWQPQVSLDAGLAATVAHFRAPSASLA